MIFSSYLRPLVVLIAQMVEQSGLKLKLSRVKNIKLLLNI